MTNTMNEPIATRNLDQYGHVELPWSRARDLLAGARNLAVNPACSVSVRLNGLDLTLEGDAHRVTDPDTLERVATVYHSGGWPASVEGDALTAPFTAPSAGPAPWHLYRLTLHRAVGVAPSSRTGRPAGTSPTDPSGPLGVPAGDRRGARPGHTSGGAARRRTGRSGRGAGPALAPPGTRRTCPCTRHARGS